MNERIQELTGQALDQAMPQTWYGISPDDLDRIMEKFAELLVQECMDLFDDDPDSGTRYTGVGCRGMIKHYFGVEE